MQRGRPSLYTDALATEICERLSTGEPMTSICAGDEMPSERTVRNWHDPKAGEYKGAEFSADIADARMRGFDAIAADCLEIADDARNDWMKRAAQDGEEQSTVFNAENVQRSKLRIETRLKLLAKWDPKRYGERMQLAGDEQSPLTVVIKRLSDA